MDNNIIITDKKRMEEMLADYAFGRLPEAEKAAFERSISNFQDIESEVREVRKVFDRVQRTDFVDYYDRRTRNLSVNVLRRIENGRSIRKTLVRLMPALGITAAVVMLAVWQKPTTLDEAGGMRMSAPLVAADNNYAAEISLDDEIAEAISEFAQKNGEADAAIEIGNDIEILTTVSAPLNASFLEEQISADLSDSDLSKILENYEDESTL